MLKVLPGFVLVFALGLAATVAAQTYSPKKIRIEGAAGDTSDLLRIVNLQPGPLTKEQIETALQRLADTGLFSDLRYKVGADELVIIVVPDKAAEELPVRYANFVWWQSADLEKLVEARVPFFHGKLPLAGSLTDQVRLALETMLRDKGIDASVDTMPSTDVPGGPIVATMITIVRPRILVGNLHIVGAPPQASAESSAAMLKVHLEDFTFNQTPVAVKNGVTEIFRNAGYLDAAVGEPTFSPPREEPGRFWIDTNIALSGGFLYRVSRVQVQPAAPLSANDLQKIIAIKPGDAATALALGEQRSNLRDPYRKHGYLDAEATVDAQKDSAAHTIAYSFTMVPGQQYRVAGIDASALVFEEQSALAKNFHLAPNTLLDEDFVQSLGREIAALHSPRKITMFPRSDRANKTVVMLLRYVPAGK